MAKKIVAHGVDSVYGAPPVVAQIATLLEGTVVGLNSSGQIALSNYLSGSKIVARGFLMESGQMKDSKGNALENLRMMSYTNVGKVGGLSGLTPGATYYMTSGGGITLTAPATTTGDIDQVVGFAESASVLVITIGPEVIHA